MVASTEGIRAVCAPLSYPGRAGEKIAWYESKVRTARNL